jgi:hypothetical protein
MERPSGKTSQSRTTQSVSQGIRFVLQPPKARQPGLARLGEERVNAPTRWQALEQTAARGETDVSAATLEAAADLLTLRRDAIQVIDGEPGEERKPDDAGKPTDEAHQSLAGEEKNPGDAGKHGDAGRVSA